VLPQSPALVGGLLVAFFVLDYLHGLVPRQAGRDAAGSRLGQAASYAAVIAVFGLSQGWAPRVITPTRLVGAAPGVRPHH
jgi:hypothetical protein